MAMAVVQNNNNADEKCLVKKGSTFQCAEEVIHRVTDYCTTHFHPLRQRNTVTVASYNKKVTRDTGNW